VVNMARLTRSSASRPMTMFETNAIVSQIDLRADFQSKSGRSMS
jgi:hypothetical protein